MADRLARLVVAALGLAALAASAQTSAPKAARYAPRTVPVTIHDAGGTPIASYLEGVTPEEKPARAPSPAAIAGVARRGMAIFPIVTTKAAPGRLAAPRRSKLPGGPGVSVCVLGDDPLSLQWLKINQTALRQMNASCLVVAVRDEASRQNLRSLAGDVPLRPGSFDSLSVAMGVSVYPILVSPDGLVSQ